MAIWLICLIPYGCKQSLLVPLRLLESSELLGPFDSSSFEDLASLQAHISSTDGECPQGAQR